MIQHDPTRDNRYLQAQSAGGNIATYTFHCGTSLTCYLSKVCIYVSFLGCVTIQIQFGFSRCSGRLVVATAMDAAVRYCFRLSVANPALPHPGCPGMAFNFWVVLEVEGCRFCLKEQHVFFQKSEKLQKIEQENIKMGQRWIKPVDPVDSDYRSPKPSKSSIFFFVRLLHVALFRRLAFGTKPLAIRKRCSQHHLGRSRG